MFRRGSNSALIPSAGVNRGSFASAGMGTDLVGQRVGGQIGQIITYDRAGAAAVSHVPTGVLLEGSYQLVKYGTMTTPARGQLVFWDTLANNGARDFQVTNVTSATANFKAGFLLSAVSIETGGASAAGQFGWIQIAGLASGLYRGTVTSAVIGNIVVNTSLTTNDLDAIADGTDFFSTTSFGSYKLIVGWAYETPANASIRQVWMNDGMFLHRYAK